MRRRQTLTDAIDRYEKSVAILVVALMFTATGFGFYWAVNSVVSISLVSLIAGGILTGLLLAVGVVGFMVVEIAANRVSPNESAEDLEDKHLDEEL